MCINYDVDFDNAIVKILVSNGYKVEGNYIHSYSTCETDVYVLSGGFYAKYFRNKGKYSYNWDEMKKLLLLLAEAELTPSIKQFIDIDNKSGIIINNEFGIPYSHFVDMYGTFAENFVVIALNKLHNYGYIHGDIHMDNILIDEKTKQVKFIDLDNCFHINDPRCFEFMDGNSSNNSIEEACASEIICINLRI